MAALWPWLAVAGAGALHGLWPTSGWGFAAVCQLRACHAGTAPRRWQALGAAALGHLVSIAVVAAAFACGLSADSLPWLAGGVLAAVSLPLALRRSLAGRVLPALASFTASTVQGTGMILVPALVPLCLGASPAREITASGSLALALAAAGVHAAALLVTATACSFAALPVMRAAARSGRAHRGQQLL